jgi:hypothetical protein
MFLLHSRINIGMGKNKLNNTTIEKTNKQTNKKIQIP